MTQEEAEDLTHETFLEAWNSLPGFQARSSLRVWMTQISRRIAWRYTTKRRKVPVTYEEAIPEELTSGEDLEELLALRSEERLLQYAISLLSTGERELIHLHYTQELTEQEIGQVLNVNHHTIHTRLRKARERLRTLFFRHRTK
ncbi:MAG: sigma-70 family RNA polymerase sigma factor [Myxococcales bacterium]|nr:sigma-70 family RNA polymerase sigma factor [Myxococcales bacterium]